MLLGARVKTLKPNTSDLASLAGVTNVNSRPGLDLSKPDRRSTEYSILTCNTQEKITRERLAELLGLNIEDIISLDHNPEAQIAEF